MELKMSLKKIVNIIKENHNLPSKEVITLEGKDSLTKSDIYKIAGYLCGNINSNNDLEILLESKRKTWKKYIDYFQKTFNINLSAKIPIIYGLICSLFILLLDNQYTVKESESRQGFVKRIIRNTDEAGFAELTYQERNDLIDYLENIFDSIEYEKYGIKIDYKIDNHTPTHQITGFISVKDIDKFKRNQSALEMLLEILPYSDEIYSVLSKWRFNTGLAEMLRCYEKHISDYFSIYAQKLLDGMSHKMNERAKELLFTQKYCNEDRFGKEMEDIFRSYIEDNFTHFQDELISKCINFDFDPLILLKK